MSSLNYRGKRDAKFGSSPMFGKGAKEAAKKRDLAMGRVSIETVFKSNRRTSKKK